MEKTIYRYVLKYSLKEQIVLLVVTGISFPFLYYSYDLPKLIVNHIKDAANQAYRGGGLAAVKANHLFGMSFGAVSWLMLLSLVFLALTVINGGFKYFINVFKGRLGERMLRRMRYQLYSRILCFPLPHFKKISVGEIIAMVIAETSTLGEFVGDAVATPIFQGGLLLVPLIFILVQNFWLGLAAVALYPAQGYLIPKMQKRVNDYNKRRIRTQRGLSERLGEAVGGALEIRANDTSRFERADFSDRLHLQYLTRLRIFILKFLVKYINNTCDKVTPFFFFTIGGYLVLRGQLDIGALVAVIGAQKDLASPWGELLTFYQSKDNARIMYEQVVQQFAPPGALDEAMQLAEPEKIEPLKGEVQFANVGLSEDGRLRLVDNVSTRFPLESHVAVVGAGASGKEELGMLLARLLVPSSGKITIGEQNIADWPEAVTGRRIGFVAQHAYMFSGSIGDNLFYSLKHQPISHNPSSPERAADMIEAARTGNLPLDIRADWIDAQAAGASTPAELKERALAILGMTEMEDDVYRVGLRSVIDPAKRPELAKSVLEARHALRERLAEPGFASLVELFDRARYNDNASVGENLLFGTPTGGAFDMDRLAENPYVLEVLDKTGLTADILAMGREAASTMVELFADLPPGSELFEQYSFISADDLPEFQALLTRVGSSGLDQLNDDDKKRLLNLPFKLIPARHRLDLIDEPFKARILAARGVFGEGLPAQLRGELEFFDFERYNATSTLQDNVLFGKVAYGQPQGVQRVGALIQEVLETLHLRGAVMDAGLGFNIGSAGGRLSGTQRQKLAIAREVLKRPDLLILNDALAALDSTAQSNVLDNLRAEFKGRGLVAVLNRAALARNFDRALVMQSGKLIEQGEVGELNRAGSVFHGLVQSE
ncbi:MAG TPA: ABC transporter ATP-binding protein/permease [Alphaproteobacteria bacterium]|nr:ABC transporter ATP-binding protein/permease [Alphaproteobacteria bacterium]